MDRPFPAYIGDEPYIFVSYSHEDSEIVFQEISWLRDRGFNIWYDEGISPGTEWRDEIANAIRNAALFLYFVTPAAAESSNCRKEVNYALDAGRPLLAIHLKTTNLPEGLKLSISDRQAILKQDLNKTEYEVKIISGIESYIRQAQSVSSVRVPSPSPYVNRPRLIIAASLIGITVLVAGILSFIKSGIGEQQAALGAVNEIAKVGQTRSPVVAILPFNNLSSDKEFGYLAEGMSEDVITLLSQSRLVEVIARNSSFQYKDTAPDIRKVGRELGARYVVEGSVRKLGNRIRVTAQLIDSQTGTHVWAQKYDKTLAEIFDVQDDITTNIAAALGDAILLDASSEACQSRPENLTAWQLTARADRLQNDISDAEKSLQYLEKALELDPEYALAHAVLGRSFSWIGLFGGDRVNLGPDNFQRAEEHSKRALQLAGNDPKVLSYVAITMLWTGHPEDALPVAKRGYEMSPTYSQGIIYYADILIHNGRSEEALPLIARAIRLSPQAQDLWMYKVIKFEALIKTGRFEDAARLMSDLIHLSPGAGTWCYLALAQVLRGQSDAATRSLRNGLDLSPSFRVANFADTLEFYDAENGGEHFQRGYSVLQELEQAIVE